MNRQLEALKKKDFRDDREARVKAYKELEEKRIAAEKAKQGLNKKEEAAKPKEEVVVKDDGTVLQKNEGGWDWEFTEDQGNIFLNVAIGKYVDTSLVNLSVQPKYIDLELKKKHLRLNLASEVHPDKVTATRSQLTGHLLIKLPKVSKNERKEELVFKEHAPLQPFATGVGEIQTSKQVDAVLTSASRPKKASNLQNAAAVDIRNIVKDSNQTKQTKKEPNVSPDFVDDPDVPPLED